MKKIAIIGSGISGMTAAYLLNKKHDITLFEKDDRLGGHTATIDVDAPEGRIAVDTGFIVFNDRTYPLFEKLLDEIGVGRNPTQMSFSVKTAARDFEYNGHTFASLFAQKRNIFSLKFWRFLYNIVRFNRIAKALYHSGDYSAHKNLGDFLDAHGFDDFFKRHYILPMGAAIWSTSLKGMLDFEIQFFIRFFYNHGLLDVAGRPQWYVIPGGSKQYITPLTQSYHDKIKLNAKIKNVNRDNECAEIVFENGSVERFDEVVFACHSDQALALLGDATQTEKAVLGAIEYTPNSVVLHTDTSVLPKRRTAWASWNYLLDEAQSRPATVTYQMNILQKLQSSQQFCVTLNNDEQISASKIIQKFEYFHPVFNTQSIQAQKRKNEVDGVNRTYFCGAYWFNGFHEDGVRSAVDVAKKLGVEF
ncbi:FAD-dependent oxidoreductase [Pseudoalteromonas sp. SMS1]|uniref:NAD(P)/FAD-dependent oxidoreductase n=1 Tax=Pseudoalteromonas sp. SMS1 TaxID=2908894 RepID=UPI001F450DA1|nr:FAD-dependent oxidoreductase [Pseudoalteromonas sp. SMS1]MCF2856007.1 FAD-dependent oxidoreductase [Pseudoalteromonas sp. SMS1]